MPRYSLGKQKSAGKSRQFAIRLSEADRDEIYAALRDGETFADFVRDAILAKIKRQNKELKNV